jgi:hypothetical protein
MASQQSILDKLIAFKEHDKFSASAWNQRGLNPSDSTVSTHLEFLFNDCADNLIEAVRSDLASGQLKRILKKGIHRFDKTNYDTEEREFICDYFFQLSNIVAVDFKDNLNSWLYGAVLGAVLKLTALLKGKEKVVAVLSQDCTKCGSRLDTFIIKKEEGIPDNSWAIIRCNHCNDYNLLSVGPDIKQLRFGEYKLVEQLPKDEYTEAQANIRLEQIRLFRRP